MFFPEVLILRYEELRDFYLECMIFVAIVISCAFSLNLKNPCDDAFMK